MVGSNIGGFGELRREVHQVGSDRVQLFVEKTDSADEFLALMEGDGMCLAHSLASPSEADDWLHRVFKEMFPAHRCGPGCGGASGSHSLAEEGLLNLVASVQEPRAR